MVSRGLIQGLGALAVVAGVHAAMLALECGEKQARMLSFADLVIANLGMILANCSRTRTVVEMLRVRNKAGLKLPRPRYFWPQTVTYR